MFNLCKSRPGAVFFAAISCLLLPLHSALAGGPLIIGGNDKITPITYQNPDIVLNVETGPLGTLSNADANAMLQEAFDLWNKVSTTLINLRIDTTKITEDINLSNYDSYIPNKDQTIFNANDGLNPVVYDNNGEIIDLLLGIGQSENTIGLAASVFTDQSDYFLEGYIIINGKDLKQSDTIVKLTISHEIGHFFGLDHSQLNIDNQESFFGIPALCRTSSPNEYPIMYPYICRDTVSLHGDDVSAVSALYPDTSINSEFGILQGHFVDTGGWAILGANLWLEDTATGEAFSIVSDYLRQCTGYYKIYLPAGKYTLHANSINTIFYGGSGVGPYAEDSFSQSFLAPHPIKQVTLQDGDTGNPLVIDISTNLTTEVNFDLDGKEVNTDILKKSLSCFSSESASDSSGTSAPVTLFLLVSILLAGRMRRTFIL
ncbi:MAG: hypothetical protein IMF14_09335 [Proteobacteria bacterium]|nr:hypothetical protein [Pseudomonadota bacterium]